MERYSKKYGRSLQKMLHDDLLLTRGQSQPRIKLCPQVLLLSYPKTLVHLDTALAKAHPLPILFHEIIEASQGIKQADLIYFRRREQFAPILRNGILRPRIFAALELTLYLRVVRDLTGMHPLEGTFEHPWRAADDPSPFMLEALPREGQTQELLLSESFHSFLELWIVHVELLAQVHVVVH